MTSKRTPFLILGLFAGTGILSASGVSGKVFDPSGAVVPGAAVTLTASSVIRTVVSDRSGGFRFENFAGGNCRLRVVAPGFEPIQSQLRLKPGEEIRHDVHLTVLARRDSVSVDAERQPGVSLQNNLTTTVFSGKDLDALPDDPTALADVVRALAGPSAGPDGSQIYVDGFLSNHIPSKQTIQEIRVNQNAFAAENDRPGFGNIQIVTKPGASQFRGQGGITATHENLNARNLFGDNKPMYRYKLYDMMVSGPIKVDKSSFTVAGQGRQIDENAVINATVLDPSFNFTRLSQAIVTPEQFWGITSRFDTHVRQKQMISARYQYDTERFDNAGLGGISLPTRAYSQRSANHTVWLTDTVTLSPNAIVEARAQFQRSSITRNSASPDPAIHVLGAFYGGGAQIGQALNRSNRFELQNYFTILHEKHTFRFGSVGAFVLRACWTARRPILAERTLSREALPATVPCRPVSTCIDGRSNCKLKDYRPPKSANAAAAPPACRSHWEIPCRMFVKQTALSSFRTKYAWGPRWRSGMVCDTRTRQTSPPIGTSRLDSLSAGRRRPRPTNRRRPWFAVVSACSTRASARI